MALLRHGDGRIARRPSLVSTAAALSCLPATLLLLGAYLFSLGFRSLERLLSSRLRSRRIRRPAVRKVLITSASSPAGLSTARLLHASGNIVLAADFEDVPYTSASRVSNAVDTFYSLSPRGSLAKAGVNASETEYFSSNVLHIIEYEKPDLWIHCGPGGRYPDPETVASVKERVEQSCDCRVLHPDSATLKLLTDEIEFAKFVGSLDAGLSSPEVRNVFSRGELHRTLGSWPMKRRFVLEKLDPEDAAEVLAAGGPESPPLSRRTSQRPSRPASVISSHSNLTGSTLSLDWQAMSGNLIDEYAELDALMLPSSSMSDTYNRIASIKISKTEPWSLQELVVGEQYTAHCLVVQGQLVAFALTTEERSGDFVVHGGAMHTRILGFVQAMVPALKPTLSTHLNVRFVLSETSTSKGVQQTLYPVSADVEATGVLFLHGEHASFRRSPSSRFSSHTAWRLSRLYYAAMFESHPSALLEGRMGNGTTGDYRLKGVLSVSPPKNDGSDSWLRIGLYSLPLSVLHLLLLPLLAVLTLTGTPAELVRSTSELMSRIAHEKEECFDWQDPLPWIWFWLVGAPLLTLKRARGAR